MGTNQLLSRRELIRSAMITAVVGTLSGCSERGDETATTAPEEKSSETQTTEQPTNQSPTSSSGQEKRTTPTYSDWLGPEMAKREAISGFEAVVPSRISGLSAIQTSLQSHLESKRIVIPRINAQSDISAEDVDLTLASFVRQFGVMVGRFNRENIEATFEEWTDPQGTYRNHTLYLADAPSRKNPDERIWRGFAIGDRSIVKQRRKKEESALKATKTLLDTGAGEATRYIQSDDPTSRAITLLGPGAFVSAGSFGSESITAVRMRFEGDTAHRRSIYYAGSDLEASREYIRERVNQAKNISIEDGLRTSQELFVPYNSVSIDTKGDFIVVDGRVPSETVSRVDLGLVQ